MALEDTALVSINRDCVSIAKPMHTLMLALLPNPDAMGMVDLKVY